MPDNTQDAVDLAGCICDGKCPLTEDGHWVNCPAHAYHAAYLNMTTLKPADPVDLAERLNEKACILNADCDCGSCQQCHDGLLLCAAENLIRAQSAEVARLTAALEAIVSIAPDNNMRSGNPGSLWGSILRAREVAQTALTHIRPTGGPSHD